MLNCKVQLCTALLVILTACKKQEFYPAVNVDVGNASQQSQLVTPTTFGLAEENTTDSETKKDMSTADVNILRLGIYLSETTINRTADSYLAQGYQVQFIVCWDDTINGNRSFPKDTNAIKVKANAFFKYYANRKKQIPFIAVENEWDLQVQNGANLQDYIRELSIITAIGHKYGFYIADGGITSAALQRWTYSQLPAAAQVQWKLNYYVGLNNDYDGLLNIVNTYLASVQKVNFDYSNVHWYNSIICGNGFATSSKAFMKSGNKKVLVCNEFGIRTNSLTLFTQTDNEINGNALYAIAYSGSNVPGKAIKLTDGMLKAMN